MGRYNTKVASSNQQAPGEFVRYETPSSNLSQAQPQSNNGSINHQIALNNWPKQFPKPIVGLERDGTILRDTEEFISSPAQVVPLPNALEAIKMLRLKGYRVVILTNQSGISKGKLTQEQVDNVNNHMMKLFGEAGIFSIDGLFYATSDMKEDLFAKPNIGMFNRAKNELKVDWKKGWYVGDKISDLKAGFKAGAKPILVKTGQGNSTIEKLNSFANKDLKSQTKIYENLLEFAKSLP